MELRAVTSARAVECGRCRPRTYASVLLVSAVECGAACYSRVVVHRSASVRRATGHRDHHPEEPRQTDVDIVANSNRVEEGPLYTTITTTNLIEHTTTFDDSRVHETYRD